MAYIKNSNYPDIQYYNVDIVNGRTVSQGKINDPRAYFNETRNNPIIQDASRYEMSIVRFTMNGVNDIPIFIPVIEKGQSNPNKTVYKITMDLTVDTGDLDTNSNIIYNTFTATENVIFEPEQEGITTPLPPLNRQDVDNPYYFIHTYNHFLKLVNKTFEAVKENLQNQLNATDYGFTLTTKAPVINYNNETEKFELFFDNNGFGKTSNPINNQERYKLFFNSNMSNLFQNYPSKIKDDKTDVKFIEILIEPNLTTETKEYNSTTYYKIKQERSSTGTIWSPAESVVFSSTSLPVVAEGVAPVIEFGNSNVSTPTASTSNTEPIITDISLPLDNAYDYKGFTSYIPSGEYRMTSLNGHDDIRNINISVFWKNRLSSNLIPVKMGNLSNISIKFMFKKKHL